MNSIKPLKAKAAEIFCDGQVYSAEKIFEQIASYYPNEKYCSVPVISAHLKSLKVVGILSEDESYLDEFGQLISMYRITDFGKSKVHNIS